MAISLKNNSKRTKTYCGKIKPDIRFLDDMRYILYDRKWAKKTPNFPLYYMYRGVKKKGDLRYDITVIPAQMLGQEFPKTKGHEHSKKYQELYTVLEGKAIYLIQKYKNNKIDDVYAIEAKKGETVIIPSYYGHITINPLKNKLIEANWLNKKCQNIYNIFEKNKGACYYYTKSGWIKNKNYELRLKRKIPKLRFKKSLKKMPKNLDFLKR
jgi:glucose-6-phosphate isomerase